ncbi:hypothetical protein Y032_0031g2283 [Ancylostoma ceylanicum]|uniref:Uncharacterized protein n=1 Tax=Ancylostoma ceylanicum TaxID=53326 RepID=A0A016UPP1_9BILA|nr:hypothetical protein Y032_0031g2283 [Ancylostoma ceylanicum]
MWSTPRRSLNREDGPSKYQSNHERNDLKMAVVPNINGQRMSSLVIIGYEGQRRDYFRAMEVTATDLCNSIVVIS